MTELENVIASAKQQLARILGPERADQVIARAQRTCGHKAITSPAELLAFADAMVKEGGFVEVVGRGLKVEALLRGARASAQGAVGTLEQRR